MQQNKALKPFIINLEILAFISIVWLVQKFPLLTFIWLVIGFLVGNLILELDHLFYWFLVKPELPESQIAQKLIRAKQFKAISNLIKETRPYHTSLIFHHLTFQLILIVVSMFIFTSTNSILGQSIVFFTGTNLLIKQLSDFLVDKSKLQTWLFARLDKQITQDKLKYYLIFVSLFSIYFLVKLLNL